VEQDLGLIGYVFAAWAAVKGMLPVWLQGGMTGLEKYFFGKLFGAFVPAFFLAGAIGTWIPKGAVVKYLSPSAPKKVAYAAATVAGGLLSVCACGILPIFSAVYQRGAGIGPAMTFLFAGPAINLIAIFYTFDLLGVRLGVARVVCAFVLSVAVGWTFEKMFADPEEEAAKAASGRDAVDLSADDGRRTWQTVFPMAWMVIATLVLPVDLKRFFPGLAASAEPAEAAGWLGRISAAPELMVKLTVVGLAVAMVAASTFAWFSSQERRDWLAKTWSLLSQIVPKIVIGIIITGILEDQVGKTAVIEYLGHEGLIPSFLASLAGGVLYFGTILGVLAARFFQVMGVPDGPLLALLLAGPTVTLPSVLAITGIVGTRRAIAYFALVVLTSTLAGWFLGLAT
jgi:uncharacterized membrane protein YraQ (UPF0718 family)